MKKLYSFLILIIIILPAHSQLQSDLIWNRKNINPAFTAPTKAWDINAQYNRQWMGYKDGPQNILFSTEKYFPKIKSGFGIEEAFGRNGAIKDSYCKIYYNFRHNFRDDIMLSVGTSAGLGRTAIDVAKLNFDDPNNNDHLLYTSRPLYFPLLNAGATFKIKSHSISLSCNNLVNTTILTNITNSDYVISYRNLFATYSFRFRLGEAVSLTPQVYYVQSLQINRNNYGAILDLSVREFLSAGFVLGSNSFRTTVNNNIAIYISGTFFRILKAGYYFTYSHSGVSNATYGEHAIRLGVLLGRK
jgi:type IX secretion system PorP/SprF family membrane protein